MTPSAELIVTGREWAEDGRILRRVQTSSLPDGHVFLFPGVTGNPVLDLQTIHVGWREDDSGPSAGPDVEDNRAGVAWSRAFLRRVGMTVAMPLLML